MDNFDLNSPKPQPTKFLVTLVVVLLVILLLVVFVGWRVNQNQRLALKLKLNLNQGQNGDIDLSVVESEPQPVNSNQPLDSNLDVDQLNSNEPVNPVKELVSYKNISYGSDVNQKFDLYVPKGLTKPVPLILFVHGGGGVGGNKESFTSIATLLAKQNFVVINVNYRLMPDFTYPTQLADLQSIIQWAQQNAGKYKIDTAHIGISGHSAGSHLVALYVLTQDKDYIPNGSKLPRIYAAAPIAGGYTWRGVEEGSRRSKQDEMWLATADPRSLGIPLEQIDSNDHVTFLLTQGDKDTTVPPIEAMDFYNALTAAKIPAELAIYPEETHASILRNQVVWQKIFLFFKQNLKL